MLHFKDEGSGPSVVLLHPVGLDGETWSLVKRDLLPNFRVVTVDLRGHGLSPAATAGLSLFDYAADVANLIERLSSGAASVVGLSFGGMIAQMLAIEHPRVLQRVVIAGCPCDLTAPQREALKERGAKALAGGMEAVVDETLTRWFSPKFIKAGDAEVVRRRLLSDDPQGWAAAWYAIAGLNTRSRLAEVRIPALCVAGEKDLASSIDSVRDIANQIPNAEFTTISNAPHMMHIENSTAFARNLMDFFGSARGP
jgi:3-oxoadipate enol-lactonase